MQAAVRMQSPTRTKGVAAPFERQPDGQWRQSFTVAEVEEKSPGGSMACCAAPARTPARKPAKEKAETQKSQATPAAQRPEQRQGAVGLEGWLLKRDGIRPNWHKRWFVLRADGLHFFEQQSQPPPAVIGSYDYQAQQAQTALGGIAVQEMESVGVSTAPNAPDTELEITCALTKPLPLLLTCAPAPPFACAKCSCLCMNVHLVLLVLVLLPLLKMNLRVLDVVSRTAERVYRLRVYLQDGEGLSRDDWLRALESARSVTAI